MTTWSWACDVPDCGDRQAFYVEWSEKTNGYIGNFAGLYCNRHTVAMRAGWSPFEEYGSPPTIDLIRRAEVHKAMCEASRGDMRNLTEEIR